MATEPTHSPSAGVHVGAVLVLGAGVLVGLGIAWSPWAFIPAVALGVFAWCGLASELKRLRGSGLDAAFMRRLQTFSRDAFGPAERTGGLLDHLRKELNEIEADPRDLDEWADLVLLGLDGAWRHGGDPQEVLDRIVAKLGRNERRTWPDWRGLPEDVAIEHDRTLPEPTEEIPDHA